MPGTNIIHGHGRRTLFKNVSATVPGSTGFGVHETKQYSRLTGLFSVVGSTTFQWRMGVESGNFQVTSSVLINSGPYIFDQLSYGRFTDFAFIAANSQTPTLYIVGEPLR